MGDLNIAIADDNPQTLGKLQEILESEKGFSVVGKAENGEDAYNMIVKTTPDVVLLSRIILKIIINLKQIINTSIIINKI